MGLEDTINSRLGALEARANNSDERWGDIKDFMIRQGNSLVEIKTGLALLVNNQQDFKEYQKRCDLERESLDKRVAATENISQRQIKAAAAAGGVMAFLAYGGAKFVEKVVAWFS